MNHDPRMIVVSVRDNKSGFFLNPTVVDSIESAKRNFKLVLSNSKDVTVFSQFRGDYDLYHIGYWSSWNLLEPIAKPQLLMTGGEVQA